MPRVCLGERNRRLQTERMLFNYRSGSRIEPPHPLRQRPLCWPINATARAGSLGSFSIAVTRRYRQHCSIWTAHHCEHAQIVSEKKKSHLALSQKPTAHTVNRWSVTACLPAGHEWDWRCVLAVVSRRWSTGSTPSGRPGSTTSRWPFPERATKRWGAVESLPRIKNNTWNADFHGCLFIFLCDPLAGAQTDPELYERRLHGENGSKGRFHAFYSLCGVMSGLIMALDCGLNSYIQCPLFSYKYICMSILKIKFRKMSLDLVFIVST